MEDQLTDGGEMNTDQQISPREDLLGPISNCVTTFEHEELIIHGYI